MRTFRVVLFSTAIPGTLAGLIARLHNEVPGVVVCGVLYEERRLKPTGKRIKQFLKNLRDWDFVIYASDRIFQGLARRLADLGHLLLRIWHACPHNPNPRETVDLEGVKKLLEENGGRLLVTDDIHAPESLEFVRCVTPDLGIIYGARILKPELFTIPRQGSINIHKRKVPDYRGGGPIGLWEMLDNQPEIGVTVHRVLAALDAGAVVRSATIPIEPFDTLLSLGLKADAVGSDLIVEAVQDFASGEVRDHQQPEGGRTYKGPKPQTLRQYQKRIAASRPVFRADRTRSLWGLLLRSMAFAPYVLIRNWYRWLRKKHGVVILYHHVITDRPHRMGMPTDAFYKQLRFLLRHYRVASLREALEMLEAGRVHAPTVVLTFDDGYRDNVLCLRAAAEAAQVPCALFVATRHIEQRTCFQHDLKRGVEGFSAMGWEELISLERQGFEIGSHTRTHFDCGSTDVATLRDEIEGSKEDLDLHLKHRMEYFSFPWGHRENMSKEAVNMASRAYRYTFSAYGGVNLPRQLRIEEPLARCAHPNNLWELELTMQGLLHQ